MLRSKNIGKYEEKSYICITSTSHIIVMVNMFGFIFLKGDEMYFREDLFPFSTSLTFFIDRGVLEEYKIKPTEPGWRAY